MIIQIDPLDTLFFKDGRPFTMSEETHAKGIFPPYPSVIYGALRSAYFANNPGTLKMANEKDDPTADLKIRGLYFLNRQNNEIYLPLPQDCVMAKGAGDSVSLLQMRDSIVSSCPTQYVLKGIGDVENVEEGLISRKTLTEYLECSENSFSPIIKLSDADMVLTEPKLGISIDKKKGRAAEGMLYRIGMKRLNKLRLLVNFEGLKLPENGMMKLGGEGKAVSYQAIEQLKPLVCNYPSDGKRFKIYLSTPAFFEHGWLPKWIDPQTLEGKTDNPKVRLRLLTAVIDKPSCIGGFDMKKQKPKPMRKTVPAGSVYYFEILEGSFQDALTKFDRKPISDFNPEQGFGIAYVGGIQNV